MFFCNRFTVLIGAVLLAIGHCNDLVMRSCEEMTAVPICTPLEYRLTYYPNPRGHETQEEANSELDDFQPLLDSQCSPYLRHFLCAYYVPLCETFLPPDYTVLPCRELCIHVYLACQPLLASKGRQWPSHLHCDLFPSKQNINWCFGPDNPFDLLEQSISYVSANITVPTSLSSTDNIDITSSLTPSPTVKVSTPPQYSSSNEFGISSFHDQYQFTISTDITDQYSHLITSSDLHIQFHSQSTQSHSQSTQSYSHTTQSYSHTTQSHSHTVKYYNPAVSPTPMVPLHYSLCQPLPITSHCLDIGHGNISFPNHRGHLEWEEAEDEMIQFAYLVYTNCSPKIGTFLCLYYLPQCIDTPPYIMQPCQELCNEVKNECTDKLQSLNIEWPLHIDCSKLPSSEGSQSCSTLSTLSPPAKVPPRPPHIQATGGTANYNITPFYSIIIAIGLFVFWLYMF